MLIKRSLSKWVGNQLQVAAALSGVCCINVFLSTLLFAAAVPQLCAAAASGCVLYDCSCFPGVVRGIHHCLGCIVTCETFRALTRTCPVSVFLWWVLYLYLTVQPSVVQFYLGPGYWFFSHSESSAMCSTHLPRYRTSGGRHHLQGSLFKWQISAKKAFLMKSLRKMPYVLGPKS